MLLVALLSSILPFLSLAYPTGAPQEVCSNGLRPGSPHGHQQQAGNGGFIIETSLFRSNGQLHYQPGQQYTVVLQGTTQPFRGWVLQARRTGDASSTIGTFIPNSSFQQILNCGGTQSTVTHANSERESFWRQTFTWTAPEDADTTGMEIHYTVVATRTRFYSNLLASENLLKTAGSLLMNDQPASEGLTFRIPDNCQMESCDVYVKITNNTDPSLLSFQLSGMARAWVAVGFATARTMFPADVFACNVIPDSMSVEVLDTVNGAGYSNSLDRDQSGITLISGSYVDGRINCSFTRNVTGHNSSEDFNLDDEYYVLYGRGNDAPQRGKLSSHRKPSGTPNPSISKRKINPYRDTGDQGEDSFQNIKQRLVRAHGILMLLAWPLVASTGIFIAAFMRPALLEGKWFQAHRALMLTSLFIAAAGFVLAFVAQLHSSPPGLIALGVGQGRRTAHFIIGIIVMFLQILNPILAICRCEPGAESRWIFTLLHGYIVGITAEFLAYVNIGIGLAIFTYTYSNTFGDNGIPEWLYIAYTVTIALLFLLGLPLLNRCCREIGKWRKKRQSPEEIELTGKEERPEGGGEEDLLMGEKKETCHLWLSFAVFLGLTVAVVIALVVLVALP